MWKPFVFSKEGTTISLKDYNTVRFQITSFGHGGKSNTSNKLRILGFARPSREIQGCNVRTCNKRRGTARHGTAHFFMNNQQPF
jgi:hypothetical protein